MQNPAENKSYCLEMVREHDSDRYYASLFAPATHQAALFALFAFNQEVAKTRESVSEPMLGEIRLQWWREALEGLDADRVREHPVVQSLAEHIDIKALFPLMGEILEAREQDLYDEGTADFAALAAYANGTGGALFEAAARILAPDASETSRQAAREAGKAFAIMGLVRALPYHWQAGRSYMPQETGDISSFSDADKLFAALKPTLGKMVDFIETALGECQRLARQPAGKIGPVLALNGLTRLYLKRLKSVNLNPFELPKVEPSDLRRLTALASANIFKRY